MVVAGEEVRGGAADRINIGIGVECDVVRNEEDSVSAANYCLLIWRIRKSQTRHELFLRKRQIVAGVVDASLYQEASPRQALPATPLQPVTELFVAFGSK